MDPLVASIRPPAVPLPRRQCWECLRRRLVCDSGQPFCKKCHTAGVVCPGYEDKKPLKWVTPGRVTSRNRRTKPKEGGGDTTTKKQQQRKKGASSPPNAAKKEIPSPAESRRESPGAAREPTSRDLVVPVVERRNSVESISRFEMDSETCDIFQAVHYYNCQILPAWDAVNELAPNPYLIPFALELVPYLSRSMRHSLLCAALDHRIYQIAEGTDSRKWVTNLRPKQLYHRGVAIRTLSDAIADDEERMKDSTLAALFLFFYMDFRQQPACWRQHFSGLTLLMRVRGGLRNIYQPVQAWRQLLVNYFIAGVTGNTTSPAHDQTEMPFLVEHADLIEELYDENGLYPSLMCPLPLFLDTLTINDLRYQATLPTTTRAAETMLMGMTMADMTPEPDTSLGSSPVVSLDLPLTLEARAQDVLKRILAFVPADWVAAVPSAGYGLEMLAQVYQSALVVFCIASLQGVGVLPAGARALAKLSEWHLGRLLDLLREGLTDPVLHARIFTCVVWPLVVAGSQLKAGRGRDDTLAADRSFIDKQLALLSVDLGFVVTLVARTVLRRFWDSDRTEWDDCFDQPWLFVG